LPESRPYRQNTPFSLLNYYAWKPRLGGHCETFHDSVTGGAVDIGVIIFHDLPIVRNYFSRFNVPLVPFFVNAGVTSYVDYRTGQIVNGYTPRLATSVGRSLG
jgi:hypothetical protein